MAYLIVLLVRETYCYIVGAGLGASRTDVIRVASPAGVAGAVGISARVGHCCDEYAVPVHVDVGRGRPAPGETHSIYSSHFMPRGAERDWPRSWCWSGGCRGCGCWRRTRRAALAQASYSQSVGGTRSVGSDVAHHYHQRLPSGNFNLERFIRIRAEAGVSNPVGADVIWIEAPQVSSREDEADADARRARVNRHTLRRSACVRERVSIVMMQQPVTRDRARRSRRTGLRNTAAVQMISLRRIA